MVMTGQEGRVPLASCGQSPGVLLLYVLQCTGQDSPPHPENFPVPNASSAEADKLCTKLMCTCAVVKKSRFFESNDLRQYTSKISGYEIYFVVAVFFFFSFLPSPQAQVKRKDIYVCGFETTEVGSGTLWPLLQSIKISLTAASDLKGSSTGEHCQSY